MCLCDQDVGLLIARLDEIGCFIQQNLASPWMNTADAAKFLRCSVSQIEKLTNAGRLPYYRLNPTAPKSPRLYNRRHLTGFIISGKNPVATRLSPAEKRQVAELMG